MPFDALTIAAVRQELDQKIVGGRVQGVVAPGPLSVALEIYRAGVWRTHLLLSAHPQNARVNLLSAAPSRDPEQQPPLLLLLRKYVRGGTISSVSQPRNERILGLSIVKRLLPGKHQEYHSDPYFMDSLETGEEEEAGPEVTPTSTELIIEVMGRLSNIVMVEEDGTVMDSIKRIPASINRYRVTLPHHPYVPPPPQEKRDPYRASINAVALELRKAAEDDPKAPAWKGLVGGFLGVSPTLAREAVYRGLGDASTPAQEAAADPAAIEPVLRELTGLLELEKTGQWEPTLAVGEKNGEPRNLDFAPYELRQLEAQGAELRRYGSISAAIDDYYSQAGMLGLGGHSALRERVREQLGTLRSRDERRLSSLQEQIAKAEAAEELRRKGESIFAYMHTLEPGQRTLVVPEEKLSIELDPAMTPVENAQAYFKDYHKARSAQEDLPELISEAEMRVRLLDELSTSLELAAGYDDIRAVQAELDLAKYPAGRRPPEEEHAKGKKGKKGKQEKLPQPLRLKTTHGLPVLVGRTARQNEVATFRLAAPEDLWFHARNVPGSHVILKATAGDVSEEDIREAAALAAAYSKARDNGQVDVLCTERRYVRKVPNGPPGFVNYRNERVIRVAPTQRTPQSRGTRPT